MCVCFLLVNTLPAGRCSLARGFPCGLLRLQELGAGKQPPLAGLVGLRVSVWVRGGTGCNRPALRSLCTSGVVRLHVNSWLEVSFCLPHKIHYAASSLIPPEAIERSLKAIR